jgi:hypothetical protein
MTTTLAIGKNPNVKKTGKRNVSSISRYRMHLFGKYALSVTKK